jgi:hypothetical protein
MAEPAPISFGFPQWPTKPVDMLQAWTKSGSTVLALNNEWLAFVNRRLKEDFALPQHLVTCKGPEEMWRVYVEFLQKAVDDYQNEFAELAKLGEGFAHNSSSVAQRG